MASQIDFGLNTPEAVTIAQQLVNREKTKGQLIDEGFNRYSLNSKDGLPSWFLDDESKHYKPNLPVTKEAMAALRAKQRALDARPIKKVAEAKARKKFKAAQRLEKAMKKAEGVNATADMSEREKAQAIDKLMKKGQSSGHKPKKDIKLVVAKGAHKGVKGRPKGIKGRYVMVDSRMRKEVREMHCFISVSNVYLFFSYGRRNEKRRRQRKDDTLNFFCNLRANWRRHSATAIIIFCISPRSDVGLLGWHLTFKDLLEILVRRTGVPQPSPHRSIWPHNDYRRFEIVTFLQVEFFCVPIAVFEYVVLFCVFTRLFTDPTRRNNGNRANELQWVFGQRLPSVLKTFPNDTRKYNRSVMRWVEYFEESSHLS